VHGDIFTNRVTQGSQDIDQLLGTRRRGQEKSTYQKIGSGIVNIKRETM
jgi:hypothetical protein